jgi:peptide/nickel transport system permease protein
MPIARAKALKWPALASIGIIGLLLLLTLIVPQFLHGDPLALTDDILQPPSARHWFGTDDLGRDVLVEIIYGTRVSFLIGCAAALATAVAGTGIGSLGGFFGGVTDTVVTRLAEFFQVMPTFILAVVIVALAGPGLIRVVAVIALLSWPQTARVVRGEVLRLSHMDFVDALRCVGITEWRILTFEIIPNAVGPVFALSALIVGNAILLEASLSFLGLSDPSVISWGRLLSAGQRFLFSAWWLSLFPGLAILITVLAFNLLADGLRDMFDPRHTG